jgi:hypothetical protein
VNTALARRRPSLPLTIGLFALTATLAGAIVSLLRPRVTDTSFAPPAPGTGSTRADEMTQLRDEVQLLRRQLQTVATQKAAVEPGASGGAALAPPPAPLITPEQGVIQDRKHFENLERVLAAEPVDASWAPQTERRIAEKVKLPAFAGSRLVKSTCHSTLCRIEVVHENESQRRRFRGTFPNRLGEFQSGTMRKGTGKDPSTIVYVAREGHQIPRAAQD